MYVANGMPRYPDFFGFTKKVYMTHDRMALSVVLKHQSTSSVEHGSPFNSNSNDRWCGKQRDDVEGCSRAIGFRVKLFAS